MSDTIELTPRLHATLVKLREANIGLAVSTCVDDIRDLNFDLNKRSAKEREDAITELCHILAPPEHKKFYTPALRVIDGAEAVS